MVSRERVPPVAWAIICSEADRFIFVALAFFSINAAHLLAAAFVEREHR